MKCYDGTFEGDEEVNGCTGQEATAGSLCGYRANILLIAFNSLHLWGL